MTSLEPSREIPSFKRTDQEFVQTFNETKRKFSALVTTGTNIYEVGERKPAPLNSLGEISAKSWPKIVQFCTALATIFINIFAESYISKEKTADSRAGGAVSVTRQQAQGVKVMGSNTWMRNNGI